MELLELPVIEAAGQSACIRLPLEEWFIAILRLPSVRDLAGYWWQKQVFPQVSGCIFTHESFDGTL